jgi:hypothetical protein
MSVGCVSPGYPIDADTRRCHEDRVLSSAGAVAPAVRELVEAGHDLLHDAREEPWGQTVARLQSPEAVIIGISYTPVLHD